MISNLYSEKGEDKLKKSFQKQIEELSQVVESLEQIDVSEQTK